LPLHSDSNSACPPWCTFRQRFWGLDGRRQRDNPTHCRRRAIVVQWAERNVSESEGSGFRLSYSGLGCRWRRCHSLHFWRHNLEQPIVRSWFRA